MAHAFFLEKALFVLNLFHGPREERKKKKGKDRKEKRENTKEVQTKHRGLRLIDNDTLENPSYHSAMQARKKGRGKKGGGKDVKEEGCRHLRQATGTSDYMSHHP